MARKLLCLTVMLTVLGGLVHAAGQRPLYDARFFEPVGEVVTKHLTWAKPLYGGAPKVLFITHRNAMREVIELNQRLDLDYRIFALDTPNTLGETGLGVDASWRLVQGNSYEEQGARLRELLKGSYDVIVLGGIAWDQLPIDCRYEILKAVKAGTGLVGSVSKRDEYLSEVLGTSDFGWNWALWSGAAQGVADYFGLGGFTGSVDYSGGHTGQACLKIVGTEVKPGSREAPRGGYCRSGLKLEPGTDYVFSCWTKTKDITKPISASLHPQSGLTIPPSDDWRYNEVKFKTRADNGDCGIYLLNYSVGTIWYDDVKLVKAGTEENLLPNPSFEYPGPSPAALAAGVPYKSLPVFARHADETTFLRQTYQTATFGKGRLGFVSYSVPMHQMLTPGPSGPLTECRLDYDYYLAAAIKLILWGAHREPAVTVTTAAPQVTVAQQDLGPGKTTLVFQLNGAKALGKVEATCEVRDHDRFWQRHDAAPAVPAGASELKFATPDLPRGTYFADLWLKVGGKVVGFGSVGLEVTAPAGIKAVTLTNPHLGQGEALKGAVATEGEVTGRQLRFRARDFYDREVALKTVPVTGAETPFSLPLPPMLSITGRLEVELIKGQDIFDVQRQSFSITNRYADRQDVQFVMWMDYPVDFIGPMMAEEFTRNGIDAQYGGSLGYAPYANQWWLPYATRFTDTKTDWYQEKTTRQAGDLVRSPCLTDPAYRAKVRDDLTKKAQAGLEFSTSDFTLGDENMFVSGNWDLCFSDTCNDDFRQWARQTYGSLEALNASWGSKFANWSEVKPRTLEECKPDGNFVPWVDHRLHMESVWAGMHDFSRGVIREVVPQARVGYEGSDTQAGSFHAVDYWKLAKAMDLNNIYYRDFLTACWKDFVTPETLLGAGWFGGYAGNRNEQFMRWFPWRALFKGSNSFWVWAGYGSPGAVMAYDVSLYPFFQKACEEVAEIKSGIGKLLMGCEREHDGIALLWSAASVHVGTATPGFPDMDSTLQSLVQMLHDVGLEARVLSYEELAAGKLTNQEFKVLLLPGSQALSDAEVAAVRKFADNGGTVIADLRPGVTNEHGKPRGQGALDDLFGVSLTAPFKRLEGDLKLPGSPVTSGAGLEGSGVITDTGLALKTGQAQGKVGDVPALITNRVGKGQAVLLNFSLRAYLSLPKQAAKDFAGWEEGSGYRAFLAGLLKARGVAPRVTVAPDAPRVEISRFRQGNLEYVGIVQGLPREPIDYTNKIAPVPTARPVTITFDRVTHVYEVRTGKYLGNVATLKTSLTPGVAQLYALLPYKLAGVSVQAAGQAQPGTEWAYTIKLAGGAQAGGHVLRVRLYGPDGQERPYYACNLRTDQGPQAEVGRADGRLTFALNDAPGTWKLVAKDVATGVYGTATVKVGK